MDERTHAQPGVTVESKEIGEFRAISEKTFTPTEVNLDPPFSVYEQIKKEPYTVKYFGLKDWLFFMQNPKFDASGLKDKVGKFEDFVKKEINRMNLADSTESYAAIINNLKEKLKIHPLEKTNIIFDKLLRYIGRARGITAYKK